MPRNTQIRHVLTVEGRQVDITHPDKVLWPEIGATKLDYIRYLMAVAPYLLAAAKQRLVMMWCYPQGLSGKGYARKSKPSFAPAWFSGVQQKESVRMMVSDTPSLVWMANFCALELHVEPDRLDCPGFPTYLAFDLDPSVQDAFHQVLSIALGVRRVLESLGLHSVAKTSGATGLHVYVPIAARYSFEEARRIAKFIAEYMALQMPDQITLDRVVQRRGTKLYFDYLQLWQGKTMAVAYSTRAMPTATVSTPVRWEEVESGFRPDAFTIHTVPDRVQRMGDLFAPITTEYPAHQQELDNILAFLEAHRR